MAFLIRGVDEDETAGDRIPELPKLSTWEGWHIRQCLSLPTLEEIDGENINECWDELSIPAKQEVWDCYDMLGNVAA